MWQTVWGLSWICCETTTKRPPVKNLLPSSVFLLQPFSQPMMSYFSMLIRLSFVIVNSVWKLTAYSAFAVFLSFFFFPHLIAYYIPVRNLILNECVCVRGYARSMTYYRFVLTFFFSKKYINLRMCKNLILRSHWGYSQLYSWLWFILQSLSAQSLFKLKTVKTV